MEIQEALIRLQSAYPRIYLFCHSRHQNTRTTPHKLSQRDGSILAHIDEHYPKLQRLLAQHMGLAKSTLSEALAGLEEMGYVTRSVNGRESHVRRTTQGTKAMSLGSVLESGRLRRLLANLSEEERASAVRGLEMLAFAGERIGRNAR